MRSAVIGLGVALLSSLALNVWQWRRAPAPAAAATGPAIAVARTDAAHTPVAVRESPVTGTCPAQLATLAKRLASAEADVEQYLPPDARFERSAPAPAREPALRSKLAELFADAPQGWSWQLECRGDTCKLDVVERERGGAYDWMAKVQQGALHGQVDGMMFRAGSPSQDPVSKEPVVSRTAFMTLVGADTVSGLEILQRIVKRFRADPRTAACATGEAGFLSLELSVEPATRRVDTAAGGTLALTPVGACMRAVLDAAIAAEPIPEGTRGAVVYHTVEVPLPR